jgi:hypothetical protein
MDINNYLIAQAGKDWRSLLAGWRGALPTSFTLWIVNRFGDSFVVFDDGSVHILDVGIGKIVKLANTRDQFAELLGAGDNANNWLMIQLVDACVAAGMLPGPNQCYGYKIPPMLGGSHEIGNIELTDLSVHFSFLADIYRQTKDLPAGTHVVGAVIG